jgi:triphosphoribosyl-dephospho-CoA synthase
MADMLSIEDHCHAVFKSACLAELEALKPGNVHVFADGHGMQVQDFMQSAEVAAGPISRSESTVGQRILHAIQATKQAVGCNTNLGIVLLAAPLIQAANLDAFIPFKNRLAQVLGNLTQQDAVEAFEAIRTASPAGLGQRKQHDVNELPQCTLLEAMIEASADDLIARQYANLYEDVYLGLAHYQAMLERWQRSAWAVTAVYLYCMANFIDSHIMRKYGISVAEQVKHQAADHHQAMFRCENPKTYMGELLAWDQALKAKGINPGTSADLTVSVLLLASLLNNSSINSADVA